MTEQPLFVECINEALKEAVKAAGGAKVVGHALRPEKSIQEAHMWLLDCLNADRREHLTPEQLILILKLARDANSHTAMQFLAAECGYEAIPINPKDEAEQLQRDFIANTQRAEQILKRLEALQPKLRAA